MNLLGGLLVPLLALTWPPGASSLEECTDQQREALAQAHQMCVTNVRHRMLTGSEPEHHRICNGLKEQVDGCGAHFDMCLEDDELRLIKDIQIDAFIKLMESQGLGHVISRCEIVDEFRRSGRSVVKATDKCDRQEVEQAMERRNHCVQAEKIRLHSRLVGIRTKTSLNLAICDFVEHSLHGCMEMLRKCYSDQEFGKIKASSIKILGKVLEGLGSSFELSSCDMEGPEESNAALLSSAPKSRASWSLMTMAALTLLFKTLLT